MNSLASLTPDQKYTLINTILSADLSLAAILFGVLGFLYSVFSAFTRRETVASKVAEQDETLVDWRPHPLLWYLSQIARYNVIVLGIATLIAFGCFAWFLCQNDLLLILLSIGVLIEIAAIFGIGFYVTRRLMKAYPPLPSTQKEK